MISIYSWNNTEQVGRWLDASLLETSPDEVRNSGDVLWIDLSQPTEDEENLVFRKFYPIHLLSLEDITRLRREPDSPPHFPKVEEFPDYLFVIVNPLTERLQGRLLRKSLESVLADGRLATQLSAILTSKFLFTHSHDPMPSVQELRSFLTRHDERAGRGPDYLFHVILDAMVDQYALILDRFSDALDEVEVEVLDRPSRGLLFQLLQYKRGILTLRKTLIYEREVLSRLCRGEFDLIAEREGAYYRNVHDHLVRFTELIEGSREMVSDLMQMYLSAASNKMNEIMKVLATISTMILPMTLIAGIYGMNFEKENMPELKWQYGYPFSLALMFLTGVVAIGFFKWRKWI